MAAQTPTISIIVLATFSVSHSLRITLKQQHTAAQDGTLQHAVAADELYGLSGHCPEVKLAYARNLGMMAICEREYQEDIVKIFKLEVLLGLQLVLTTPDELDLRQQRLEEELNRRSERSCQEMEVGKVSQDRLIGKYGRVKYSNLATIENLNAQFKAWDPHAQGQRQALARSEFMRQNDMIDAHEKGYQQDIEKIDELQVTLLAIQQLAVGDELYRRLRLEDGTEFKGCSKRSCEEMEAAKAIEGELIDKRGAMKFVKERDEIHDYIEELKKELHGRSERSCEELEAAKGIQGALIGKYKEVKYLNLATIRGLTAQINAHLIAQNEMQALVKSEFARRSRIIDDYEKGYVQDTLQINDLQAALCIHGPTAADELYRRIRIEVLEKKFDHRSKRSYKEMEAVKYLQDEVIVKYKELKHVCLAAIKELEEGLKRTNLAKAEKLQSKGEGKATM